MIHEYFQRGVAAGLVAGLAYGLYMVLVGNPLTGYVEGAAGGHEGGHDHGHAHEYAGHAHEHAGGLLSEATTAAISAGSGVLWAILLGGVFAVALYFVEPALPGRGDLRAFVLAGAGFFSVSVTPWLALPPAVPGAENLYGIDTRLVMYLALVAVGLAVSAAAILAYNRLSRRHVGFGIVAGAVPLLAAVVLIPALTPTIVTNPDLSADLVAAYRGLVVLSQAALWLLIAAAFTRFRRWESTDRTAARAGEAFPNP
jgi:hypothetical protein